MKTAESIDHNRKHRKLPSRKDGFAGGKVDPRAASSLANASRWSKDRRTVVALAQEARPEAFATVVAIMRDEKVEPPTRLRAGELILAYSDGKPRQSVDVSIGGSPCTGRTAAISTGAQRQRDRGRGALERGSWR